MKKKSFRPIFWSVSVFFVVFPLTLLLLIVERVPVAADVSTMNTDNAVKTRALAKQVLRELLNENDRPITISVTEDELNGVFAIAHRAIPRTTGWAEISDAQLELSATVRLPETPLGAYLNFQLILLPSETGFYISEAVLGKIALPDAAARFLIRLGLDLAFGKGEGAYLLDAVNSVALRGKRVDVHLKPIPRMNQLVENMRGRLKEVRDEVRLMGDPAHVRDYYRHIMALSEQAPRQEALSFGYYMGRLFKIAREQAGDPVAENRAAILALGIYFGSWRVEQMIGPVRTEEMLRHTRATKHVGLAGRRDLRLHFIISAALEIASESGVTHAIGEFKELLDAGADGSGFSFADLAADRAGVRFAEVATDPETAILIQGRLSENAQEDQFFPDIAYLPEGLSQSVFERYFGSVESERYLLLVEAVDRCLSRLPVYVPEAQLSLINGCDITSVVPVSLLLSKRNFN